MSSNTRYSLNKEQQDYLIRLQTVLFSVSWINNPDVEKSYHLIKHIIYRNSYTEEDKEWLNDLQYLYKKFVKK